MTTVFLEIEHAMQIRLLLIHDTQLEKGTLCDTKPCQN